MYIQKYGNHVEVVLNKKDTTQKLLLRILNLKYRKIKTQYYWYSFLLKGYVIGVNQTKYQQPLV